MFQNAVKLKIKRKSDKREHWLDYSIEKCGKTLVEDVKATLKALFMFLPMPVFWALVEQIGSIWTFQARRMNGDIGFYTILPDQMQFAYSFFYVLWIPIFGYAIYPVFNKLKILTTPLQRVTCGGMITAFSFVITACVSLALEATYPILPSSGQGHIRIYNTLPCDISINCPEIASSSFLVNQRDLYQNIDLKLQGNDTYVYEVSSSCYSNTGQLAVYEEQAVAYYFRKTNESASFFLDDISKHNKGMPKIR